MEDLAPIRRGQTKEILLPLQKEHFSDFNFLVYKQSIYIFQRIRRIGEVSVYEQFNIGFSLKEGHFFCSISSTINRQYINSNSYNNGLINPKIDLIVLKKGVSVLSLAEAYYYHDGTANGIAKVARQIFIDIKDYGLAFLDSHLIKIQHSQILKKGLAFINGLRYDKLLLKKEVETQLVSGKYLISSINHPVYIELKKILLDITGQAPNDRERIPKTTLELLEIYWN